MKTAFRQTTVALALCTSVGLPLARTGPAPAPGAAPAASAPRVAPAPRVARSTPPPANAALRPCTAVTTDPPLRLALGKSQVIHLDYPATRIFVGGQAASRAGRPVPAEAAPGAPASAA